MKTSRKSKRVEKRFIDKNGSWESTGVTTFTDKDEYWEIPLETKAMKKFLIKTFAKDLEWAKQEGQDVFFSFGRGTGSRGVLVKNREF